MLSQKIAIIRRNGLGDFISATVPVCNYIKEKHPTAELHIFMSRQNQLLAKYFFSNDVIIHIIPNGNKYLCALLTAICNRGIHPEIGLSPSPCYPKLNSLFLFALGAKKRFGPATNGWVERLLINHPVQVSDSDHFALQTIKIFDNNIYKIESRWFPKMNRNQIAPYNMQTLPAGETRLIIELSNNRATSQIELNKMADILNSLFKKKSFVVLISLKEKDMHKAILLQQKLHMTSKIALTPSLEEFIQLVNASDIFMFRDGGAGHIAGALDKKGLSLYGDTPVNQWGVLSDKVVHLYDKTDVNNISTELIVNTLEELMQI